MTTSPICACTCHSPDDDAWVGWCDDCTDAHVADLAAAVRFELVALWSDLAQAIRTALNGRWSIGSANIADRIVRLSRLVGTVPWRHVETQLLIDGVYERVYAGMEFEPIDWQRVRQVHNRYVGGGR